MNRNMKKYLFFVLAVLVFTTLACEGGNAVTGSINTPTATFSPIQAAQATLTATNMVPYEQQVQTQMAMIAGTPTTGPTNVPATVAVVVPTSTQQPAAAITAATPAGTAFVATPLPTTGAPISFDGQVYWSPFKDTTDRLPDVASQPYFAEPGTYPGMNGNQTAWDKLSEAEEHVLVPEGGGTYIAWGGGCIDMVDAETSAKTGTEVRVPLQCLPKVPERLYVTFIRGLPADGTDLDRNRVIVVYDYVQGTAIDHIMPLGAYWSLNWTLDQIKNGFQAIGYPKWPNCGDNGCKNPYVVVDDLDAMIARVWYVTGPSVRDWARVTDWAQLAQ